MRILVGIYAISGKTVKNFYARRGDRENTVVSICGFKKVTCVAYDSRTVQQITGREGEGGHQG